MAVIEDSDEASEAGFSLIEVIVAMVLLGILAIGALPMFVTGLRITAANGAATSATAAVSSVLEEARAKAAAAPTAACQALQNYAAGLPAFTDAQGRAIAVGMDVSCTGASAVVTVKATRPRPVCDPAGQGNRCVSTASTIIYLPS